MVEFQQSIFDRSQICVIRSAGFGDVSELQKELGDRRIGTEACGPRLREEQRDKLGAILCELEQRLVYQVQQQIPPANVEDDRHRGLHRGDVREVLLRSHAQV